MGLAKQRCYEVERRRTGTNLNHLCAVDGFASWTKQRRGFVMEMHSTNHLHIQEMQN